MRDHVIGRPRVLAWMRRSFAAAFVLLGARLYVGISDATFRQIVLGLLTVSGVMLLASSLPTLLQR